jgi:hypothetical protein
MIRPNPGCVSRVLKALLRKSLKETGTVVTVWPGDGSKDPG